MRFSVFWQESKTVKTIENYFDHSFEPLATASNAMHGEVVCGTQLLESHRESGMGMQVG